MNAFVRIVSKGVMMGAAIMFTAIRREHTFYSCFTLSLFNLATTAHVAMSLSPTILVLYVLIAISSHYMLAAAIITRPQFVLAPMLDYAPVIIAFLLWIIEDCSRLLPGGPCRHWWDINSERCTSSTSPAMRHGSMLSFCDSVDPNSKYYDDGDDDKSTLSTQDSLLLRYMWSPSPSCVPSSRLSDISLPSVGLESLPSSWGALTRIWFPEFPVRGQQSSSEPSHTGCRRARTV